MRKKMNLNVQHLNFLIRILIEKKQAPKPRSYQKLEKSNFPITF